MSLTPPEKEPTEYNKADYIAFGCITGIISLIVALVLTAFFVTSDVYRKSLFRTALSPLIHDAPLPTDERDEIQDDLDQVLEAFDDGKVTLDQLQELAEHLSGSPVLLAGAVAGVYDLHIQPSTLGDNERLEAKRTLYNFTDAAINGRIDAGIIQRVGRMLQAKSKTGGWLWKSDLTLDEARNVVEEAREALDNIDSPDFSRQGLDTSAPDETTMGEVNVTDDQQRAPPAQASESGKSSEELEFPDVSAALAEEVNELLGKDIIKPQDSSDE